MKLPNLAQRGAQSSGNRRKHDFRLGNALIRPVYSFVIDENSDKSVNLAARSAKTLGKSSLDMEYGHDSQGFSTAFSTGVEIFPVAKAGS
jgi:hypothetical protein